MKLYEFRQNTQLARDVSCQHIIPYETIEEITRKMDPDNEIVSNSELDIVANLPSMINWTFVNLTNSLGMSPVNSLETIKQ
jgi:hypothetical protein